MQSLSQYVFHYSCATLNFLAALSHRGLPYCELTRDAALWIFASLFRVGMIDDMNMRRFSRETQRNYIREVGRFATFLGRSPDTSTADDLRGFQIEQRGAGVPTATMNSIVSALRFFFTHTVDRPDLARKLVRVAYPRNLPIVDAGVKLVLPHFPC